MEKMPKRAKSAPFSKKLAKLLPIIVLTILMATASAAVFTRFYGTATATVKTPDVQLIAGSDSTASPAMYPNATVTVAATYDYATVGFSLFPSATNSPQPETYYTNLTLIKNVGTSSHTLTSVTISGITGASNLGALSIYYYTTQTDSPDTGSPAGNVILTSSSSGSYTLVSNQILAPSAINYIEIVGNAAAGASNGATITFSITIQWA